MVFCLNFSSNLIFELSWYLQVVMQLRCNMLDLWFGMLVHASVSSKVPSEDRIWLTTNSSLTFVRLFLSSSISMNWTKMLKNTYIEIWLCIKCTQTLNLTGVILIHYDIRYCLFYRLGQLKPCIGRDIDRLKLGH